MSLHFYQTTWCHVPDDNTHTFHRRILFVEKVEFNSRLCNVDDGGGDDDDDDDDNGIQGDE
jgi:hypothetical protein